MTAIYESSDTTAGMTEIQAKIHRDVMENPPQMILLRPCKPQYAEAKPRQGKPSCFIWIQEDVPPDLCEKMALRLKKEPKK